MFTHSEHMRVCGIAIKRRAWKRVRAIAQQVKVRISQMNRGDKCDLVHSLHSSARRFDLAANMEICTPA